MLVSIIALSLTDLTTPGFNEHEEPLGICYVAGAARAAGHNVRIVQQTSESDDEVLDCALEGDPQVLAFTAVTAVWRRAALLAALGKRRLRGRLVTVIGGSHACAAPEECATSFDYVVIGEGDRTFVKLLEAINCRCEPRFLGLCYRRGRGIVHTGYPERIHDLDDITPDRRGLDHTKYDPSGSPPVPAGTTGFAAMITSRGCTHSCGFCSNASIWRDGASGRPLATFRSPDRILEEVKWLRDKCSVNYIAIEDTDFLARPRDDQYRFFRLLSRQANDVKWACMARPDRILPARRCTQEDRDQAVDYVRRLADAGCHLICLGVESGDESLRSGMGRRFADDCMLEVFDILTNAGIATTAFFVLGLPNETAASLQRTRDFVMQLPALRLRASFFYPFRNIPCTENKSIEWFSPDLAESRHATTEEPTVKCGVSRDELLRFRDSLLRDFYTSDRYLERVNGFASKSDFWQMTITPWIDHLKSEGYWSASKPQGMRQSDPEFRANKPLFTKGVKWSSCSLASMA